MNVITKAILDNKHISNHYFFYRQSWENFVALSKEKILVIYGTGVAADLFIKDFDRRFHISDIVFIDKNYCGYKCADILSETLDGEYANYIIQSPDMIQGYNPDELCVLITSTNYYEEIACELENVGIRTLFSLLIMESMERRVVERPDNTREYVTKCMEFPIKRNKIVFMAFNSYADHGKYITEELVRRKADVDIVWIVNNLSVEVPDQVRLVKSSNKKKIIYEMETAGIWISNALVPDYLEKRNNQFFIETKHWASVTLKRFYLDSKYTDTVRNVDTREVIKNKVIKWIDYIVTGSDFDTESCRRGFAFNGEVWQLGSPRTDAMFSPGIMKEKVCKRYGIAQTMSILLYAPTYRTDLTDGTGCNRHVIRNVDIDYDMLKIALRERFGGDWSIMLRLHPGYEKYISKLNIPNYIIDASMYPDGEELCAACDVMISDYSSIMFEPAFAGKPVFLFAVDKEQYISQEYDLLMDYSSLPFPCAISNVELRDKIMNFNQNIYQSKLEKFMDNYGVREDGQASIRAVDKILKLIKD